MELLQAMQLEVQETIKAQSQLANDLSTLINQQNKIGHKKSSTYYKTLLGKTSLKKGQLNDDLDREEDLVNYKNDLFSSSSKNERWQD